MLMAIMIIKIFSVIPNIVVQSNSLLTFFNVYEPIDDTLCAFSVKKLAIPTRVINGYTSMY